MSLERAVAELERTRANLLQVATIAEADYSAARVRVQLGEDYTSAWLPWLAGRAGGNRSWAAPEVGEQVLIACPDGDPANGVVLGAIYQQAHAAPADSPDLHRTVYSDGASISYDREAHILRATLPAGGEARIEAPGGVIVTGDLTVTGDIVAQGEVTAGTGSIHLTTHLHTGVEAGSSVSGPPQ